MPWWFWVLVGLITGGVVVYMLLLWYLAKGFRR